MLWAQMTRSHEDDIYMISIWRLRRIAEFWRQGYRIERLRWYVVPRR